MATKYDAFTNKGKTLISYDEWISKKQAEAAQSAIKTVDEEIKKLNLPQNTDVSKYGTYDTEISKVTRAKELYDSLSTYLSGLKVTNSGLKSSIDNINKSVQQNSAYYGGLTDYFNGVKGYYSKYADQADFDNRAAERADDLAYFILSNPDKNYKDFYSDFADRKMTELSVKGMSQKIQNKESDPVADFIKSQTKPNVRTQKDVLNDLKNRLENLTEEDAAELMTEYYAIGNEEKRNIQKSFSKPMPQKDGLLSDMLKTIQPIKNLNEQTKENKNREVRTYLSVAQGTQNIDLDKYTEANTENFEFGKYMNSKEKKTYSFLEDRFGEQFAKNYYSGLEEYVLRDRKLAEKVQSAREWGATNLGTATLSWFANRGLTLLQGAEFLVGDKDKATGFGEVARPLYLTSINEALSAGAMEAVDLKIGKTDLYDFFYGLTGSVVDSQIASLLPYGIGFVNLGLSSASSKYNEMVERGADINTALLTGLVAGAAEAIGEALSLGKIKGVAEATQQTGKGFLNYMKGKLISSGVNASEEAVTELVNIAYDSLANGDFSQYNTLVAEYSKTMSKEEAKKKASSDIAEQLLSATISGAFAGGMHYDISTVVNAKVNKSLNEIGANIKKDGNVQSYIETVEQISNKLNLEELDSAVAKDLESAITNAKENDSDHNIGVLSVSINRAVNEQNISDIQNILSSHTNESLDVDNVLTGKESVTNLAEGITDRTAYAKLLNSAIQGKTLTQKEMKTLKSAVHYEEIYSRVTSDPDIIGRTEATMLMNVGVNAVNEIFDKYSSSKPNVDSGTGERYNISRGDANELYNFKGNRGGNGETQGYSDTTGTEKGTKRTWGEEEESFRRRASQNTQKTGRGERILVENKGSLFAYTPAKADGSEASRAVDLLKSLGINAIYCEGYTESNKNGTTTIHKEATTSPDGTIYVSSTATLSAINVAAHEAVHFNEIKNPKVYDKFKKVVEGNILWGTDRQVAIAKLINKKHFDNGYNIKSDDFHEVFIRELIAHVNGYVTDDINEATKQFSPMFKDWEAVVEASKQFNNDIGADFTESALLMPQNESADTDNSSDESILTEPTVKKADSDPVRDYAFELGGREYYTYEQLKVVSVARKFGRKVIFEDTTKTQGFKSDGYYDSEGNIHLDYDNVKPLEWILKHELTHFGEGTDAYNEYVEVLRKTKAYKEWLQKELRTDEESLGKLEGLMRDKIMAEREAVAPINPNEAQAEIIANFSATFAFANDSRGIEALTADMSLKEHNAFVQFLIDFISYLKKKLGGSNKTLTKELSVLEDRYLKMLTYKSQNPTTNNDSGVKYSISESIVDETGKDYGIGVILDNVSLDNLSDEQRREFIKNFVKEELAGEQFLAYDNSGNVEILEIAKNSDRIKKDGSKNRQSAIDKLGKYFNGNEIKQLSILHIDEISETSQKYANSQDNAHGWFDENGWDYRESIVKDNNGNIYKIKMDIAKTRDGRLVIYNITPKLEHKNSRAAAYNVPHIPTTDSVTEKSSPVNNIFMQEAAENSQENISKGKNNGNKYSLSVENENEGLYNNEEDNTITDEEDVALLNYKSSESYKINASLRDDAELTDDEIDFIRNLDSALSKLPIYQGRVYRNIAFDDFGGKEAFDAFLIEHEEGNYITYKAYTSASTREDGYEVEGTYTVKMIINSINARDVDGYGNNFEREVIFPRRSKYVVDKVVYDSNGQPIIYLTEVTNNGKGNNGQLHSEKRSKAVQPMQEPYSRNGNLQGLSTNDSRRDSLRRSGLQGVSTERIASDSKNQYSIPTTAEDLLDRYESGEISREEFMSEVDELYTQSVNDFGHLRKGERPKNAINKYSLSVENEHKEGYNVSRANEEGDNINEFYSALNRNQWRNFYKKIAEKGYLEKKKVGDFISLVVGDKLILAERQWTGKDAHDFQVIDVYRVNDYADSYILNEIKDILEESGVYDSESTPKTILRFYKRLGSGSTLERFNRNNMSFDGNIANRQSYDNDGEINRSLKNQSHRSGIYDQDEQHIQGTEGGINSKNKYSIPTETEELLDRYESGEISREEFMSEVDELYIQSVNDFGHLRKGERPKNAIKVPQRVEKDKKTHRFVRTIIESGVLTDEMLEETKTDILLGNFSYKAISDETAKKKADQYIKEGKAESIWEDAVNGSPVHISKETIAVGEKFLMEAAENNDHKKTLELSSELCDVLTRAGQVVQAARMLKQMNGLGKLVAIQRQVKTINKDLVEKYGEDRAPVVKIDEILAEQLASLNPGQEYEIVFRNIMEDVAAQMPSTFLDKWNAWRYFAMLANPRTHIRNLVGNGIFTPAVRIKDFIAAGMEAAFVHDRDKRTKSAFIKPEYKAFAEEDIKKREAKAMLQGNGQLDDRSSLESMKKIFETDILDKAVKGNTNLMEAEDMLFKSIHYRHALAGFLQARKVDLKNVDEKTLNEAREYAVNEAKKATFQDFSYAAEMLNHLRLPEHLRKNTAGKVIDFTGQVLMGGLLPFKRTPINIIKRGIEYSPLGLAQTTIRGLYQVRKGNFNVSQFCDGLAANLTGTGLLLLGMLLCSQGLVTGGFDDDEEDRIKKLNGEQEYSVQIFGKSFTIDWAAPACIPFFIGVEVLNAFEDTEDFKLSSITKAVWNALEPITNLSMLSGIQSVISSAAYADDSQKLAAIVFDIGLSYVTQGIPSMLGATSRTIDSTQRSWYTDKNSQLDSYAQQAGNTVASKVPGLSHLQVPSFDEWGRAKSRGGFGERVLENFVSPGYFSSIQYDEVETELKEVFKATGERTFPTAAEKSFKVNGETKYLTADEYVVYAQAKGEMSYEYAQEFINSAQYNKLTDVEKAKVISNLYKYANAKAKTQISDYDITDSFKTVSKWEKNGKSVVTYYIGRALDN